MKIACALLFASATNGKYYQIKKLLSFVLGQKPAELKVFKTQSKLEWVIETFYTEAFPKWSAGMKAKTKRVALK